MIIIMIFWYKELHDKTFKKLNDTTPQKLDDTTLKKLLIQHQKS